MAGYAVRGTNVNIRIVLISHQLTGPPAIKIDPPAKHIKAGAATRGISDLSDRFRNSPPSKIGSFSLFYSLNPDLRRQSSGVGHRVRRGELGGCLRRAHSHRARLTHPLCLPVCFSRHSAAKAAFQMGLAHRWGGGELREGLLVNWQSREFGALSLSPTPMLSFPSLPLTSHSLRSSSVARLHSTSHRCHLFIVSTSPSTRFFSFLLISLIEQRSFVTIRLSAPKSTSAYLSFKSWRFITVSVIWLITSVNNSPKKKKK